MIIDLPCQVARTMIDKQHGFKRTVAMSVNFQL